ncbi:hypothetical protein A2962_01080 [Candidatus Woesebacteria bacterium RIFCSPLOWO2_01_FULL_39_61]|uniref:Uncharacterized protein n=1 Tax=Candidatus Woesebacteria bacterium RIFCSPHIGHO2_02_FULL_39_13 TaxID=1802505 RepID=A0A1F7YYX1_9BACT|nr:MAG: hypothetical protein A3D01_04335 [Candidatus Woesebacteria bacterium RIFCSPHIGHO2_02_FULL_39_13]OGM37571.1 MAG: hypothetical protein A3E13_05185 [Candidatus Woesebacteria bacterium RIFCSPHIGHO2_12_FULL_40_20]OGM65628.1 MAG: hypothetical protein A2962_01080 [Candidatus Woesebacteria bacterium RIFCSPLOWO2_01_FULL_39_61]OGM73923.1 MAG: hypothetical protein A3H19_06340 [Candidatus Woesebacteria bacterium RIFCSPLOWO2_12_FULL_39_9]
METRNKKIPSEGITFLIIISGVIILGIFTLFILQKLSVHNKFICSYLGGLWMKKDADQFHRCYTYEEFYR